jgi:hypothetical protein
MKHLRDETQESTIGNFLKNGFTLISFLVEIMGVVGVNKGGDLFMQFFSLVFIRINYFLSIIVRYL